MQKIHTSDINQIVIVDGRGATVIRTVLTDKKDFNIIVNQLKKMKFKQNVRNTDRNGHFALDIECENNTILGVFFQKNFLIYNSYQPESADDYKKLKMMLEKYLKKNGKVDASLGARTHM